MRNWKNWLFPILTALTVAALALLPLRLSILEDGELTGTVHAEPLTADNNFPSRPPELPGRIRLLAQYCSVPELLTIVAQEPEAKKREELSAQTRRELERLAELGILPEKSNIYETEFYAGLLYLRDQRDLSSAAFATLDAYDKETGETLSLYLDGESGQILALQFYSELLWDFDVSAEDIGEDFLGALGLEYASAGNEDVAVFRPADSDAVYWVHRYKDYLGMILEVDWETADDDLRAAMGYPLKSETSVDADLMQKW